VKIGRILFYALLLETILTIASKMRYETESMVDLVVIEYGFPFAWLFHQTTSFAGPVDIWSPEFLHLVLDFLFRHPLPILMVLIWRRYKINKDKKNSHCQFKTSFVIILTSLPFTSSNSHTKQSLRHPSFLYFYGARAHRRQINEESMLS
jgi:hypothetical protein